MKINRIPQPPWVNFCQSKPFGRILWWFPSLEHQIHGFAARKERHSSWVNRHHGFDERLSRFPSDLQSEFVGLTRILILFDPQTLSNAACEFEYEQKDVGLSISRVADRLGFHILVFLGVMTLKTCNR